MIPFLLLPIGITLVAARKAWRRLAALLCLALAAQGCAQWRMSADRNKDYWDGWQVGYNEGIQATSEAREQHKARPCAEHPNYVWRDGECRRVR